MNLEIMLGAGQVKAIARVLNAPHSSTCKIVPEDYAIRDRLLSLIVGKASVIAGLDTPEIRAVVQRDYDRFHKSVKERPSLLRARTRSRS